MTLTNLKWSFTLDRRYLLLFHSIVELLDGLLDKVEFLHLDALILLDSGLNSLNSRLITLLTFNNHLDPLLLLPLQILDNRLMIDQVLLVLGEVLSANILDSPQFGIVLVVDIAVTLLDLRCCPLYIFPKF